MLLEVLEKDVIIIVLIIAFILLFMFLYAFFYIKLYKKVKENSKYYYNLLLINKKYNLFLNLKNLYNINYRCDKKNNYDKFKDEEYMLTCFLENNRNLKTIVEKVDYNSKAYNDYITEFNKEKSFITKEECREYKISYFIFKLFERKLYKRSKVKPVLKTQVVLKVSYTSLKGKKYYSKEFIYKWKDLQALYFKSIKLDEEKRKHEYFVKTERAKMSTSLRYDVLKRDNFKCVICGASAREGAKLHVDHILPISKGGKTDIDNLQTLCERCNLGKSNKI